MDAVLLSARIRAIAFVAAVLTAAGVLAHLHVAAQVYHPVVDITSAEGLEMMAVQDETGDRRACGEANQRFLAPFRDICKTCRISLARCERELTGLQAALVENRPLPHYVVLSPGLRLAVIGPAAKAREACAFVAGDLAHRGYRSAVCIEPRAGAGK